MLENCCYDFFELLTLNMVRQGLFGELVHAEGAYIHDLSKDYLFNKKAYADMWRLKENIGKNGNLYPTHGLGPIAQCMNINRGDKFDHLVSMSTNDFTLNNMAKEMASKDDFFKEYVDRPYRGNMNTTLIKTNCKNPELLCHAGLIYAKTGNKEKAKMLLNEAMKSDPVIPVSLKQECNEMLSAMN